MTTLTMKDATGKDAGTVELDAAVFGHARGGRGRFHRRVRKVGA